MLLETDAGAWYNFNKRKRRHGWAFGPQHGAQARRQTSAEKVKQRRWRSGVSHTNLTYRPDLARGAGAEGHGVRACASVCKHSAETLSHCVR